MTQSELLTVLRGNLARFETIPADDLVSMAFVVGSELTPEEANSIHRLGELLIQVAWWGRLASAAREETRQ